MTVKLNRTYTDEQELDKSKTVGGSVGISTSGINSIGINYNDRKQEGTTKNTVALLNFVV